MKMTRFTTWVAVMACGLFLAAPAYAITLSDPGVVGAFKGDLANANSTNEAILANALLDLLDGQTSPAGCNITSTQGCMAASDPGPVGGDTYSGNLTLNGAEGGTAAGATFAIGKYNGQNGGYVLFYLPESGAPDQFSNPLWGVAGTEQYALSHVRYFTGGVSTPDGGTTLSLLGLALAGIGAVRRYMSA
jgi:VPDSG-CTERM motif